jgi:DNA-binding MarR family transcriptional regulator
MNDAPLPSIICTAMMRLGTRMATVFDQTFARFGITQAQFRVLISVCEDSLDGTSPSVLADRLLLQRATVSVITQRMVERGLLERAPGENRRSFRLRLTLMGMSLLEEVIPHAMLLADETLAENSHDDLRRAMAFLERLEANLRGTTSADGQ